MSFKFYKDCDCEYFPCHEITAAQRDVFNCRFCFCPLYQFHDCGGSFVILENGIKDCSGCTRPHFEYDAIIGRLIQETQIGKRFNALD